MARIVLLLVLLAPAAHAQTSFTASPGLYVVVENVDPLYVGDGQVGLGAEVGWRLTPRLDAGVIVGFERTDHSRESELSGLGDTRAGSVGVALGVTVPVGERAGLRLRLVGAASRSRVDRARIDIAESGEAVGPRERGYIDNAGGVSASVSAFRRISVGRARLQPTLSARLSSTAFARTPPGRPFTLRADATTNVEGRLNVGVALPVSARAFARLLTLEPSFGLDVDGQRPDVRLRLRIN